MAITAEDGGIINDPVLLRLGENHFWLALADSDVLLWARGVALKSGLRVRIAEPDVSPLQIQGPKAKTAPTRVTAWRIDARRVLAPAWMFAPVRAGLESYSEEEVNQAIDGAVREVREKKV